MKKHCICSLITLILLLGILILFSACGFSKFDLNSRIAGLPVEDGDPERDPEPGAPDQVDITINPDVTELLPEGKTETASQEYSTKQSETEAVATDIQEPETDPTFAMSEMTDMTTDVSEQEEDDSKTLLTIVRKKITDEGTSGTTRKPETTTESTTTSSRAKTTTRSTTTRSTTTRTTSRAQTTSTSRTTSTTSSKKNTTGTQAPTGTVYRFDTNKDYPYMGNTNSKKFHRTSCDFATRTKESNRTYFETRAEAIEAGYEPCQHCKP